MMLPNNMKIGILIERVLFSSLPPPGDWGRAVPKIKSTAMRLRWNVLFHPSLIAVESVKKSL